MSEALRIVAVAPVVHGVLKLVWTDGYEGVVDLRPVIAKGNLFAYLDDPEHFDRVELGEYGHSIFWLTDAGETIDFGADSLRDRAEKQAALHLIAS